MSKIIALDLGDKWVGIAISDKECFFAKPHKTIDIESLYSFLEDILQKEDIKKIIIGYPKTLSGKESEQTIKVINTKKELEAKFLNIDFILWDERFSSKRSQQLRPVKNKFEKLQSHAIAAAYILDSYLSFLISKI